MIEKLKGISNWQTVVVMCFYLSAVLAITIVAIIYDIVWLIAGGSTTLGIVAGSLTSAARSVVPQNLLNNVSNEQLTKIELAQAEQSVLMANLKSEVEVIKIDREVKEL